ncbi:MAG: acyltransferase family protein [Clostridiales bacterium]|nr:acyltransferase family protein [Clostridiales bacterium]
MNTTRKTEIDIAKGFAVFLVILGHIVIMHQTMFRWIFSFHMPAFFILSGMTFHPERYSTPGALIKKKGPRLLLIYFSVTLIGLAICLIRPAYRTFTLENGWGYLLKAIFYYGQPQHIYVGQVWFLAALFFAELITWGWFRCFSEKSAVVKGWSLLILALIAVNISRINPYLPIGQRLPWKLDTALCAAVFVIAGVYAARTDLFGRLAPLAPFLVPLFVWLSYYLGPCLITYVNICDCVYNDAAYYFAGAFIGSAALILAAWWSPSLPCRPFFAFWQFCGRNSLQIFVAHTFVTWIYAEIFTALTGIELVPAERMPGRLSCLLLSLAVLLTIAAFLWVFGKLRQHRR